MNQPRVTGTKNKPYMSLQPPKFKSPQQIIKRREADLPRTPYPMPSKGWKPTVLFGDEDEDSPPGGEAKKRKIAINGSILSMPSHPASFPSLDPEYPSADKRHGISPAELTRAWESILDQIVWSEVVQGPGRRGKPNLYRDAFQGIVQAHVEDLLKQEECREDMILEHSKRDDEDTTAESRNDRSEDDAGDDYQLFKDNTFVESDESEYGSEEYIDNENDDGGR